MKTSTKLNPIVDCDWQIAVQPKEKNFYFQIDLNFKKGSGLYNAEVPETYRRKAVAFATKHDGQWIKPEEMPAWLIKVMAPAAYDGLERG